MPASAWPARTAATTSCTSWHATGSSSGQRRRAAASLNEPTVPWIATRIGDLLLERVTTKTPRRFCRRGVDGSVLAWRLAHAGTGTGRPSSRAGGGKVEVPEGTLHDHARVYVRIASPVKRPRASRSPGILSFRVLDSVRSSLREHGLPISSAAPATGAPRVRPGPAPAYVLGVLLLGLARSSLAQSLPEYAPVNPVAQSRSGLYFQPYREPRPGHLTADVRLDYGSAIEYNLPSPRPSYLLDGEFLRLELSAARDLNDRVFLFGGVSANGAYGGFLDDVRLGAGYRPRPWLQTALAVTLPTATGPAGYGRGTLSLSALNTLHARLASRFVYEGSLGFGWTPTHGDLAAYQKTVFAAATSGLRFRFWGRQSLFANLWYHSPYYHRTGLRALDRRDLSLDFGWLLATKSGRESRIGMTEDLEPSGPAIDITFRFGASF